MDRFPDRRFVRLRLEVEQHPAATVTITAADPGEQPSADDHDILAGIAAADPARAAMVTERIRRLIGREAEFFDWLEKDPRNSALFVRDPAAAIRAALPDLAPDFFAGWDGRPSQAR